MSSHLLEVRSSLCINIGVCLPFCCRFVNTAARLYHHMGALQKYWTVRKVSKQSIREVSSPQNIQLHSWDIHSISFVNFIYQVHMSYCPPLIENGVCICTQLPILSLNIFAHILPCSVRRMDGFVHTILHLLPK